MAEIQAGNKVKVEKFLRDWFVKETAENVEKRLPVTDERPREVPRGWGPGTKMNSVIASDYAEIAEFLSIKERWEPAVEKISELLREHYIASLLAGRPNAFTSAISMIAPTLGFSENHRFLSLAGFTDRNDFRSYVAQGAFWKDAVSSMHGEHSHSIQWLTLAKAYKDKKLITHNDISTLYRRSVDYTCTRELYHADNGRYRVLLLWDWLVDCFDHGEKEADFETNITSRTARSPTCLNKYLFEQGSRVDRALWIGQYLTGRHQKRGWKLPAAGPTELKAHAIARAKAKGHRQIASNGGGNFVYEVQKLRGGANRLSKVHGLGVSEQIVKMAKGWGPIPSYSYQTSLGVPVAVLSGSVNSENFSGDKNGYVRLQIEVTPGGCKAFVMEYVDAPPNA